MLDRLASSPYYKKRSEEQKLTHEEPKETVGEPEKEHKSPELTG